MQDKEKVKSTIFEKFLECTASKQHLFVLFSLCELSITVVAVVIMRPIATCKQIKRRLQTVRGFIEVICGNKTLSAYMTYTSPTTKLAWRLECRKTIVEQVTAWVLWWLKRRIANTTVEFSKVKPNHSNKEGNTINTTRLSWRVEIRLRRLDSLAKIIESKAIV